MSDINSSSYDADTFESRAVYPDERTYYKSNIDSTEPDTATVEAEVVNNYLRSRNRPSPLIDVEIETIESE